MSAQLIGLLGILGFLVLLSLRMPVSYAMTLVGFIGFSFLTTTTTAFAVVTKGIFGVFTSYTMSIMAMFIWMGFLAYYSGMGTRMYAVAYSLIGHYAGGLAMATQAASAVFGAICGSNTATAATIGAIALPEMKKFNYDPSLATASVAAGGVLGVLIPPSVILILYGVATEQSVGKLFIAGIVPGILLMLANIATIYIIVSRKPEKGPAGARANWSERLRMLRGAVGEVLAVFVLSVGGMFLGWFTPTEAGAIGAAGVLAVTLIRKMLSWEGFKASLAETTRTTAMIMVMIAGATIFGRFMAVSKLPLDLANWAGSLPLPPYAIMAVILIICLILGCFIDALALILLTIPIFYPVVVNNLGYDPIWFGVIMVFVMGMGVITPPVGMNVYIIKGVAPEVPLETIFKGIWPFLFAQMAILVLFIAFPQIVTFLPNILK